MAEFCPFPAVGAPSFSKPAAYSRTVTALACLIALFDAAHVHHDAAHAWFGVEGAGGWATCPLTENAVVRILSSPQYPGRRTTMQDARSRLANFCATHGHAFWPDLVSLRDSSVFHLQHVQGHRQLTDIYLLALAVHQGGRLATFDAGIPLKSVAGAERKNLQILR